MTEQLRLEGTEVPSRPFRLPAATVLAGKNGVAACRAVLAAITEVEETS